MRQPLLRMLTRWQWCSRRSIRAAASTASPSTCPHSSKPLFEVNTVEARSCPALIDLKGSTKGCQSGQVMSERNTVANALLFESIEAAQRRATRTPARRVRAVVRDAVTDARKSDGGDAGRLEPRR